jgi:hypothetical protein
MTVAILHDALKIDPTADAPSIFVVVVVVVVLVVVVPFGLRRAYSRP